MPIPVEEMWRLQRSGGYTKGKEIEDFSKSKNRKVQMEGPYEQLLVCAWRRMQTCKNCGSYWGRGGVICGDHNETIGMS